MDGHEENHLERTEKDPNHNDTAQYTIKAITGCIWPDILSFYESEESRREFAVWESRAGSAAKTRLKYRKDPEGTMHR
jgi:hypothetical protein